MKLEDVKLSWNNKNYFYLIIISTFILFTYNWENATKSGAQLGSR